MTRADALRAARALLDAMAGTTEGEWDVDSTPDIVDGWWGDVGEQALVVAKDAQGEARQPVCASNDDGISTVEDVANAAYIARACPARLGPVLRALMGED